MSHPARFLGMAAVFVIATCAWLTLGATMSARSVAQDQALEGSVQGLWGTAQSQAAPTFSGTWTTQRQVERAETVGKTTRVIREQVTDAHSEPLAPSSTRIDADIHADPRLKGLVWYPLYDLRFQGTWTCRALRDEVVHAEFAFPAPDGLYDGFRFVMNGTDLARSLKPENGRVAASVPVKQGEIVTLEVAYVTRGMGSWSYAPGTGVTNVEDLALSIHADVAGIDFPQGSLSPSTKERTADGWDLNWTFAQVVTGRGMGIVTPRPLQPGELASDMALSAPVSLLLFFVLLGVTTMLRGIDVHPVNYLFIAAAFFAFHLLFAYLVDHVRVVPAFVASSVVSVFLVVSYLRLVVSVKFAFVEGLAQVVYLVGFSLAHFWSGFTGLTVTVLSIVTLYALMQLTGRVRWARVGVAAADRA